MGRLAVFEAWITLWIVALMCTTIFNPFRFVPFGAMTGAVLFLVWFGFFQVRPRIDWDSKLDIAMAYNVIAFFGSMTMFIVLGLFDLEHIECNNWEQIAVLLWFVTILIGLAGVLYEEHKTMGFWKYIVGAIWVFFAYILVISCLGFFFNIYVV